MPQSSAPSQDNYFLSQAEPVILRPCQSIALAALPQLKLQMIHQTLMITL